MTNLERLQSMTVDEFTDWLMIQLWPELTLEPSPKDKYTIRWHAVRNYLLDTYEEDNDDTSD